MLCGVTTDRLHLLSFKQSFTLKTVFWSTQIVVENFNSTVLLSEWEVNRRTWNTTRRMDNEYANMMEKEKKIESR